MILSAQTIRWLGPNSKRAGIGDRLKMQDFPLIEPFVERSIHVETGMSFGLGPCGYDIRVREDLRIDAGRMVLASSFEHFHLPDDLCGRVMDKSTWARKGVAVQNTIMEPGWKGYLTLEISYHGNYSGVDIPAGAPIAQVVFERLDEPTQLPYRGKYQDQPPIPMPALFEKVPAE